MLHFANEMMSKFPVQENLKDWTFFDESKKEKRKQPKRKVLKSSKLEGNGER